MLDKSFRLGDFVISNEGEPYFIAEVGSNHNQSFDTALKLIDVAARSGANAVKFQLFSADKLYPPGTEMHGIFKSIELNKDWVPKLARHAAQAGIHFMASAFDTGSVDMLGDAGVVSFKVASSEATNVMLLVHIAQKARPLIISTGMCDMVDIIEAVNICEKAGLSSIALLQCGAVYPLPPEDANLRVMDVLRSVFGCPVGFSDHSTGIAASIAAVARGACIIEKHFTMDRHAKGPDHFYALEPDELAAIIRNIKEAYLSLGKPDKQMLPKEREFGRREGIYAACIIEQGKELTADNMEIKRPALGIRKRQFENILGMKVKKEIKKGSPVFWEDIF